MPFSRHTARKLRVRPRAHANTRSANSELCHVRLPCAGAPWPSRAARTSCAPLALPEAAAYPLTPRRARRSTPHQHYLAFLRPVQALHTASGTSQAAVPGRAASTTQILHHARHARTPAPARARARAHLLSLLHSLTACLHTHHTAPCARTALNDVARTPQQQPALRLTTTSRAHSASSPVRDTAARASARLQSL